MFRVESGVGGENWTVRTEVILAIVLSPIRSK